ncbi:MAG TPA: hypothetical protein VL134_11385 [Leptolyngbya sp.]|jgi:hypothetical protein|nr:hypothetical protein [Leptolyngbya sp.]
MKVSKLSSFQAFFYAGLLSLSVPAVSQALPTNGDTTSQDGVAQSSANTPKTYESKSGFQLQFPSKYSIDSTQTEKGVLVLRSVPAKPPAEGSDEPAPVDSNVQSQSSPGDEIRVTEFANPQKLTARQWAEQNKEKSFFDGRQSDYRSYSFAGKPAISYSWCATSNCGDSVIVPSQTGERIFVLSALYDYPGNAVRWDFKKMIGSFRLTQ